jgi:hypothetical protein
MYYLEVVFVGGTSLKSKLSENELRNFLKRGVDKSVKWANVVTPSGVKKEITDLLKVR